jgi:hypothetical protein
MDRQLTTIVGAESNRSGKQQPSHVVVFWDLVRRYIIENFQLCLPQTQTTQGEEHVVQKTVLAAPSEVLVLKTNSAPFAGHKQFDDEDSSKKVSLQK